MMEMMTGEAGVLRTALGVVLAREGIDVRVRVYLWSAAWRMWCCRRWTRSRFRWGRR